MDYLREKFGDELLKDIKNWIKQLCRNNILYINNIIKNTANSNI